MTTITERIENYFYANDMNKSGDKLEVLKDQIRKVLSEFLIVKKEFEDIQYRIDNNGEEDLLQIWWGAEARKLEKEFELSDLLTEYDRL